MDDIIKKIDNLEMTMGIALESDKRSFSNPESEYGWLFDKIASWKSQLEEIESELQSMR